MLGKLIKYEFKATARCMMPIYIVLFILSIIGKIFGVDSINQKTMQSDSFLNFIGAISLVLYLVIYVVSNVVTIVVIIQRFYKSLLQDEGYLMNTLPVKASMHIASKLITSVLWMFICTFLSVVSIMILAYSPELIEEMSNDFGKIIREGLAFDGGIYLLFFELILFILVASVMVILIMYLSVIIGHLFKNHKLGYSFVAFIGISIVYEGISVIVARVLLNIIGVNEVINDWFYGECFAIIFTIYILIVSGILFFISSYLLKNKLNLE